MNKPMMEYELDSKIDKAPAKKVRECLKQIIGAWFVEDDEDRTVNFDKELNSDTLEDVTGILHTFGFSPKESHFFQPNPPTKKE